MRILPDTSVLISSLLPTRAAKSATGAILEAAYQRKISLLFAMDVIEELQRKLRERPELAVRIPDSAVTGLVDDLRVIGQPVPKIPGPFPAICRDRHDDYLIAHAVVAEADYLVSWGRDLLDLHQIDRVKIVSPPELLAILRENEALEGVSDER